MWYDWRKGNVERKRIMEQIIIRNAAQCAVCGDVIESTNDHDFVTCSCGTISVDGGKSYLRRSAKDPFAVLDRSEWIEVDDDGKRTHHDNSKKVARRRADSVDEDNES